MSTFFVLLLIASIICFVIGLVSPQVFRRWFGQNINRGRIALIFGGLIVALSILTGAYASPSDKKPAEKSAVTEEATKPKIEIKEETKTEEIVFQTTNQDDATLEQGQTKVQQEGKNGLKEFKYKVTYTDGKETSREPISETITTQPVDKIVLNGTKVPAPTVISQPSTSCSDGYYKNVDGNCVKSPGSSPEGATAKCHDGTYSYSQHRSGTCSGHGGVAEWYQ